MPVRKRRKISTHRHSNFEKIKEEVITLLTGQDPDRKGDFDYWALVKRVTVLLVAIYGISRVRTFRQMAYAIVTAAVTSWLSGATARPAEEHQHRLAVKA